MAHIRIEQNKKILIAEHKKCAFELMKGLMFKKNGNALLEFKKPGKYKIWMLFMRYPLTLYFIDENLTITDRKKASPLHPLKPNTWKLYWSKKSPYKYILEVDEKEKINFEVGKKIKMEML